MIRACCPRVRHARHALLSLAAMVLAAGCNGDRQGDAPTQDRPGAAGPVPGEARTVQSPPPAPVQDRIPSAPPLALPGTRALPVLVEGQLEQRDARLFESPQGYAIYVLPQVVMTQEEPCCDIAFARADDGYFMRIERIAPETALDALREAATLALSTVGAADAAAPGGAPPAGDHRVELHLVARGGGVTVEQLVLRAGEGRYRVTLHLPSREASEGIVPTFRAMLGSLQTIGPLRRP